MKISKQEVTLLDSMGSDLSVVNAARVSFDKESVWETEYPNGPEHAEDYWKYPTNYLSSKDEKLIKYLAKHNHWSPFSHCSASFRVKAPIFVARQLAKHQVGFSWNEVSRRYVDSEPEFFMPEVWRKKAENVKQGSSEETVKLAVDEYDDANPWSSTYTALETYNAMIQRGACPEQARMVLPQNTMTEWIWTGTLYAWARMCLLRLDSHAQKECQEVAQMVSLEMAKLFPVSWPTLTEVK